MRGWIARTSPNLPLIRCRRSSRSRRRSGALRRPDSALDRRPGNDGDARRARRKGCRQVVGQLRVRRPSLAGIPHDEGIADIEDRFVAKLLHAGEHLGHIDARQAQLHAFGVFAGRDDRASCGRCVRRRAVGLRRRGNRRCIEVGQTDPQRERATLPDANRSGPGNQLRPWIRTRPDTAEAAIGDAWSGGGHRHSHGERRRALRKRGRERIRHPQIRQRIRTGILDFNRIRHIERGRSDDCRIAGADVNGQALRRHGLVHIRGPVVCGHRIGHSAWHSCDCRIRDRRRCITRHGRWYGERRGAAGQQAESGRQIAGTTTDARGTGRRDARPVAECQSRGRRVGQRGARHGVRSLILHRNRISRDAAGQKFGHAVALGDGEVRRNWCCGDRIGVGRVIVRGIRVGESGRQRDVRGDSHGAAHRRDDGVDRERRDASRRGVECIGIGPRSRDQNA